MPKQRKQNWAPPTDTAQLDHSSLQTSPQAPYYPPSPTRHSPSVGPPSPGHRLPPTDTRPHHAPFIPSMNAYPPTFVGTSYPSSQPTAPTTLPMQGPSSMPHPLYPPSPMNPPMMMYSSTPPMMAHIPVITTTDAPTPSDVSTHMTSFTDASQSSLNPRKEKKQRPRSPSSVNRPTDTFHLPFPNGYYRIEVPIKMPSMYPHLLPGSSTLRYTAASCGFSDFANSKPLNRQPYTLRQQEAKKKTKMLVVITMYNEDVDLFSLTLGAVYKNIEYLCQQEQKAAEKQARARGDQDTEAGKSLEAKPITWQDIVVCIVADGRQKCPPKVKVAMEMLGCYQSNELIMTDFQEDPVQAHLFEYTSSVHLVPEPKKGTCRIESSKIPTQYLVCMKEFNKKKIDSHGWAFDAFCPLLQPEVVVLLDMGTKPATDALYHFWKHFEGNPKLGGVCGEIVVDVKGSWFLRRWINFWRDPLLAAQNFEYKMSNILDKPLQSVFGYITVLPGAFSAYRYAALEGKPLEEYFKAEGKDDKEETSNMSCLSCMNIGTANKYLAEDRILCFEIFTKHKEEWLLRYISEAKATTDAPDNLGAFLNQRRRWLNGSMFAFFSAFGNMFQVFHSRHSFIRKIGFLWEMLYLMLDTLMNLLGPMNFYSVFIVTIINSAAALGIPSAVVLALGFLYILLFIFGFIIYVGNNPRGSQFLYKFISRIWMLVMILTLTALGYNAYLLLRFSVTPIKAILFAAALLATYGLYLFASLLFLDTAHMISSIFGYMLMLPTYVNMMLPFALSNIHDISWGTRPQEAMTARILPKNKFENGQMVMDSTQKDSNEEIVVDVQQLSQAIQKGSKGELKAQKKGAISVEDQNKNFRFIFLFVFFFTNLFGAAAITYGAFTSTTTFRKDGTVAVTNTFVEIYMLVLFGAVAGFAFIRFMGCVLFKIFTPSY